MVEISSGAFTEKSSGNVLSFTLGFLCCLTMFLSFNALKFLGNFFTTTNISGAQVEESSRSKKPSPIENMKSKTEFLKLGTEFIQANQAFEEIGGFNRLKEVEEKLELQVPKEIKEDLGKLSLQKTTPAIQLNNINGSTISFVKPN